MSLRSRSGKIAVIAHRGGSNLFLENTMTAFRNVQELGVDAIEIDIHASSDGKLIVIHDPDLYRIAGVDKLVSEMSYQDISEVELPGGERVPYLEQVLEEISIPLVIELKTPDVVDSLIEVFKLHPAYVERCVVISFFHDLLGTLKSQFPELITGALLAEYPSDPVALARSCNADTLSFYFDGINKAYVDQCHQGGLLVNVWTPNSEKDIANSIKAGVDSITSDRPDLVLKALER